MKLIMRSLFLFLLTALLLQPLAAERPPKYDDALRLYSEKKYTESLDLIRSVFDTNRNSLELRLLAAANYASQGGNDSAITHLLYAIQEHPNRPEARVMLAGIYRKMNQPYQSIRLCMEALAVSPDYPNALMELAKTYYSAGNFIESRRQVERVLQIKPKESEAYFLDGLIFFRQGSFDNAEFRFRNALRLKPESRKLFAQINNNLAYTLELMADRQMMQGEKEPAIHRYREAGNLYRTAFESDPSLAVLKPNRERIAVKLR